MQVRYGTYTHDIPDDSRIVISNDAIYDADGNCIGYKQKITIHSIHTKGKE